MKAVIETTHLLLRPWQEDDLNPLVRLLAKPEVAHYIRLDGQVFTGGKPPRFTSGSCAAGMNRD